MRGEFIIGSSDSCDHMGWETREDGVSRVPSFAAHIRNLFCRTFARAQKQDYKSASVALHHWEVSRTLTRSPTAAYKTVVRMAMAQKDVCRVHGLNLSLRPACQNAAHLDPFSGSPLSRACVSCGLVVDALCFSRWQHTHRLISPLYVCGSVMRSRHPCLLTSGASVCAPA